MASNQLSRTDASERLRDLLLRRCPDHAVEIFQAAADFATATMAESHSAILKAIDDIAEKP